MLDELGPWLSAGKAKDLRGRIESPDPDQSLPAEYELALSWAVGKVAHLEIDRLAGTRRPDIYSTDFLPVGPVAVEVTAMSDDPLTRKPLMRRAANMINECAAKLSRNAGRHLYYTFMEVSGHLPANRHSNGFTRYFRRPSITPHFKVTPELNQQLKAWLLSEPAKHPLRYTDDEIDVVIQWQDHVFPTANTFCSMPGVTYDVRENPLYNLLKSKARQLRDVPTGTLRAIFLGDAGSSLLRDIRPISARREVSGEQIISRFLQRNEVDLVAVFVPRRASENAMWNYNNPRLWHTFAYTRTISDEAALQGLSELRNQLPAPYLHGYQARSWHKQGATNPQARGHYLGAKWTSGMGKAKVQISARGLQEFLAGRITADQLRHMVVGEHNPFEINLRQGKTIAGAAFQKEPGKDDDYVIFEFDDDPAARRLQMPPVLKDE